MPGNAGELDGLVDAGVRGFKCFLVRPASTSSARRRDGACAWRCRSSRARRAAARARRARGSLRRRSVATRRIAIRARYRDLPRVAPAERRRSAIRLMIRLAARVRCAHPHRPRLVGGSASPRSRGAKAEGVPLTAETCPHYLTSPPRRFPTARRRSSARRRSARRAHREALWGALGAARSISSRPITRRAARAQNAGRLRARVGRHRVARAVAARWQRPVRVSRRAAQIAAAASRTRRRSLARWMSAAPARARRLERERAHRRGLRRRPRRLGSGREFVVDAASACSSATSSRRTPGDALRGSVHATFCAASASGTRTGCVPRVRRTTVYDACTVSRSRRSRVRASRRRRRRRRTTSSSRRRRTCSSRRAGVARRRIHRSRQVDGRLGDAPSPRSRPADYDWCIVRLGVPGRRPRRRRRHRVLQRQLSRACAIDVVRSAGPRDAGGARRAPTGSRAPAAHAARGRRAQSASRSTARAAFTHLRLRIFPDGGVARLRVHGEVVADWDRLRRRGDVDLAAVEHGGVVVACSDMFFGSRHNLIMPGDARSMGDGWETQAAPRTAGTTGRSSGSAPPARSGGSRSTRGTSRATRPARAASRRGRRVGQPGRSARRWRELLPRTPLQPHTRHVFEDEVLRIRRRHARAAQHLSRRRRRPAAAVRPPALSGQSLATGTSMYLRALNALDPAAATASSCAAAARRAGRER